MDVQNDQEEYVSKVITKYLYLSRQKVLSLLQSKYNATATESKQIEQETNDFVLKYLSEKYHFNELICTNLIDNKINHFCSYNPDNPVDFIDFYKVVLSIPFYQSLGDTIGYFNGNWEFNYGDIHAPAEYCNQLIYEFISLGGINDISITNWKASDDTILYLKTLEVLSEKNMSIDEFGMKLRLSYLSNFNLIIERDGGILTKNSLEIQENIEWNQLAYSPSAIGAGAAMRTGCIGMFYPGKHNRSKLIALSVEASRITHNSAISILGSITSALFTAYAIEKVPIAHWPHKLLNLLKSNKINKYMEESRPKEFAPFKRDSIIYLKQWENYIAFRFSGLNPKLDLRFMINPVIRYKYLSDNFSKNCAIPGGCADDCMIMAYDSLLESGGILEKIIVYAILHPGDSDTVGSVALSWFGAFYHSPSNEKLTYKKFYELEFYNQLIKLFIKNIPRMAKIYYYDIYLNIARKYLKRKLT